ncbi:hypothetical protein ALC62_05279, partial [Cyphomyrmex costatus]
KKKNINYQQKRRWWIRPINQKRNNQGDGNHLIQEMRLYDVEVHFQYTRLTVEFLATGDTMSSITFASRVGQSTVYGREFLRRFATRRNAGIRQQAWFRGATRKSKTLIGRKVELVLDGRERPTEAGSALPLFECQVPGREFRDAEKKVRKMRLITGNSCPAAGYARQRQGTPYPSNSLDHHVVRKLDRSEVVSWTARSAAGNARQRQGTPYSSGSSDERVFGLVSERDLGSGERMRTAEREMPHAARRRDILY